MLCHSRDLQHLDVVYRGVDVGSCEDAVVSIVLDVTLPSALVGVKLCCVLYAFLNSIQPSAHVREYIKRTKPVQAGHYETCVRYYTQRDIQRMSPEALDRLMAASMPFVIADAPFGDAHSFSLSSARKLVPGPVVKAQGKEIALYKLIFTDS